MSSQLIPLSLGASLKGSSNCVELSSEKPCCIPSDNDLMTLVQHGDQEAFGQVFDRYYIAVRGIARKMLRDPEDVADVVQESFFDLYQNARSFAASKGTLKGWITCLAYHRALKRLLLVRKRQRESGDLEIVAHSLQSDVKPEQIIRSLDFRKCLDTALGNLHDKQRRTMLLYFFEGQELSVIAMQLGESLGNTRHHLYRGLTKLRGELVQKGLLQGYIEFVDDGNGDKVPGGK